MSAKRRRVRAFVRLMYAVVVVEAILAVVFAAAGSAVAGVAWLAAALLTMLMTRLFWRGFERRGADYGLYSWRALYRRLRG